MAFVTKATLIGENPPLTACNRGRYGVQSIETLFSSIMNIWASKKDTSIKHLLLLLQHEFKPGAYEIIDAPADNERAVRFTNPQVTDTQVYVYTYGLEEERYGVHIEYPNHEETNYYDTMETQDNIDLAELITILIMKLEIPQDMVLSKDYG
jgi:hypothetical protein